ncbi:g8457 [Coccomyxa elongata]
MAVPVAQIEPIASADKDEELFDIVDEQNNVIGQERRNIVHAQGIKHRAVYCFVFNSKGQLLLQQRSAKKKIGPLQWDLSIAEHLEPGEEYRQAAARGLREELGINVEAAQLAGPLVPVHLRELRLPEKGVRDCEFVTSFRLDGWEGTVVADPAEVHAWRFVSIGDVRRDMQESPDSFTAWFRDELHAVKYFSDGESDAI